MKTNLIRFSTTDGIQTQGLLFEPDRKTETVCIHVHGSAGNFYENNFIDNFSKAYTDMNIAFLAFNNRGSEFYKEFAKIENNIKSSVVIGMLNEEFEDCVYDIQGTIDYVKSLGYKNIILQGHSLGCNKVIYYANKQKFNGKVILLAPCDLVHKNGDMNYDLATKYIKEGKGTQTIPNFWGEWNISANTLVSVWGANTSADIFRYRDDVVSEDYTKLTNNILVEVGTVDSSCVSIFEMSKMEAFIKKLFNSASLQFDFVEGGNHHYKGCEDKIIENIKSFLN